ncbi:MAG TPA: hypothetical protein VGA61_19675 [Anaerolineae bacterium]
MGPEAGQAWFRVALFITLVAIALLFVTEPGSAEFVMSVASLVVGLAFIAIILFLTRGSRR